jgi:tetratricopeptide (TPR) repeat protein
MMMRSTKETAEEEEEAAAADIMSCACCGVAAIDDVKLKDCDGGCDLVKYCNDECQNDHREQHDEECRKRLVEIRDRDLFTMPEGSHWGECPICCLPLPIQRKSGPRNKFMPCCSKRICGGCHYTNGKREYEAGLQQRCAFCREPIVLTEEDALKNCMKRIKENNDPAAMCHMGKSHHDEGDYETALKYSTKAAELGDAEAHYSLSIMYDKGRGVGKDMKKAIYHTEEAAIAGHPGARQNLGIHEAENGRFERAKKHFIIAANLGYHDSLSNLMTLYKNGHASKEDYADSLRAYQVALEATKSVERKKAESYYEAMTQLDRVK